MPIYTYDCKGGHSFDQRAGYDDEFVPCMPCKNGGGKYLYATRRPFYMDYGVSGLPTRGPIVPPPPAPRSTAGEKEDIWFEKLSMTAHEQHEHSKKYGRGGEYASGYNERPKSSRE